jgi:hypothetical protein
MSATPVWISLISLIVFLALMSGFWIGLVGLWRTRRGASWWLMAVGIAFNTIGPVAYAAGMWMIVESMGARMSSGAPLASSFGPSTWISLTMGIGGILMPVGVILFAIGFAIHGLRAARTQERAGELEQLAAAMSAEIDRLKEGEPQA